VALIVAFLGLANPSGPTVGEFARVAPSETTLIFLNVQVVDDTEDDEIEETEVRSEEIVERFWNAWALKI